MSIHKIYRKDIKIVKNTSFLIKITYVLIAS